MNGVQGVEGSNPFIPTRDLREFMETWIPFFRLCLLVICKQLRLVLPISYLLHALAVVIGVHLYVLKVPFNKCP